MAKIDDILRSSIDHMEKSLANEKCIFFALVVMSFTEVIFSRDVHGFLDDTVFIFSGISI